MDTKPTTTNTISPRGILQQIHPNEAEVFRNVVVSPAFKLSASAALAEFAMAAPSHDQMQGATAFLDVLCNIATVEVNQPGRIPKKTLPTQSPPKTIPVPSTQPVST